jgi:CTP:molybdopterin cytidylyltransferase MocA
MTALSGIVLAAGEGRRMGGEKALLALEGATLVEHHVARLAELGCQSIAVVVRPSAVDLVRTLVRAQHEVRVAGVTTRSQAESLAAALAVLDRAGRTRQDVIIVTPVDMLPAEASTYRALLACLGRDTLAVTPLYRGRGGHPVIVRRALLAPYEAPPSAAHPSPPSLREVLTAALEARRRIEVDDPRVLGDLDTPADVRALARTRRAELTTLAAAGPRPR